MRVVSLQLQAADEGGVRVRLRNCYPAIELVMWRSSQFSVKAIAAFAHRGMWPERHYKVTAGPDMRNFAAMTSLLPPPHTIPALKWEDEVISGSDHICAFLDIHFPSTPFYPVGSEDEVRRLEARCSALYWPNGFLSVIDPSGFDRFCGNAVRGYARSKFRTARALLSVAPRLSTRILHAVVEKDFRATMRRRRSALAGEKSVVKVYEAVRDELHALESALAASPTPFFAGSQTPSAADLTLYCMLERWVGDSLQPTMNGPSQPDILDGLAHIRQLWDGLKGSLGHLDLQQFEHYEDLVTPMGSATWPRLATRECQVEVQRTS
jgi:glutathione S-transferase